MGVNGISRPTGVPQRGVTRMHVPRARFVPNLFPAAAKAATEYERKEFIPFI
jgi:hypothetical protein